MVAVVPWHPWKQTIRDFFVLLDFELTGEREKPNDKERKKVREAWAAWKKKKGSGAKGKSWGGKATPKNNEVACLKKSFKAQKFQISALNAKMKKMSKEEDDDQSASSDENLEEESTSNRGHPALMRQKQKRKK